MEVYSGRSVYHIYIFRYWSTCKAMVSAIVMNLVKAFSIVLCPV